MIRSVNELDMVVCNINTDEMLRRGTLEEEMYCKTKILPYRPSQLDKKDSCSSDYDQTVRVVKY